ncbi:hypothetical protein BC833DRAFT_583689 [Globomyces pollinis-pini]|nr:hypothetical protein BC833DRAFT_583689 [Globomyces pollinis-pini]
MTSFSVPASLLYFTIFNPKDVGKGEDNDALQKQIAYFYPPLHLDQQLKQIGLIQTLMQFSLNFDVSKQCHLIKTQKTRTMILITEIDYIIIIKIRLGAQLKVESGRKYADYLDWELFDSALESIPTKIYQNFKFFHHSFNQLRSNCKTIEDFRLKLDLYFTSYLQTIDFNQLKLLDVLYGIKYAPFDIKLNRMSISAVNQILTKYPQFQICCLLWKETLVWSGFSNFEDTRVLYNYIVHPETGKFDDLMINQVKPKGEAVVSSRLSDSQEQDFRRQSIPFSGYLIGPYPDKTYNTETVEPKYVYLTDGSQNVLIVYQLYEHLTICLLSNQKHTQFCQSKWYIDLQSNIQQSFSELNQTILTTSFPKQSLKSLYYYVTYNSITFTMKTGQGLKKKSILTRDVLASLNSLHVDFTKSKPSTREVLIQGPNNVWICGLRSENRDLYLIIHKDDLNLGSIQDEINWFKASLVS